MRGLARAKVSRVVMICRDRARGEAAADEVRRNGAEPQLLVADLSVQGDVRRAAEQLRRTHERVDVLIHNAGAIHQQRRVTVDGIEQTFAVNHLAPFLLTQLLLDLVEKGRRGLDGTGPARIIVVASQVEKQGRIDFDDLNGERSYAPLAAYSQSKLANVLFTYALARRLEGHGVTVNCLHPGVIATTLLANYLGKSSLGLRTRLTTPGPEAAARMIVRLALDPSFRDVTGAYFHETRRVESSAASRDRALQERLWEVSETLVSESGRG